MSIEILKVGILQTNCYILSKDNHVLVIDPGDEFEKIKDKIYRKKVDGIIVTHYHFDHCLALQKLQKFTSAPIFDHTNLKEGLNKIKNFTFKCIYTPGHKEDLITIYFEKEKLIFCGDFIFKGTIGRCDLEGSNFEDMKKSITKIINMDENITIYPGHGDSTTLKDEKENLINIIND